MFHYRGNRHSPHGAEGCTDISTNLGKIIPVVLITDIPVHTITTPEYLYFQFITSYYMFRSSSGRKMQLQKERKKKGLQKRPPLHNQSAKIH